jgi:hypothetical protein
MEPAMSAGAGLVLVLAAFVAMITTVMRLSFRARRLAKTGAPNDEAAQQASDARLLATIFGSIIGGMVLTLITAWLVFF